MSTRRSKKVKNLEETVDLIFSQEESEDDCKLVFNIEEKMSRTPSHANEMKEVFTPRASKTVLQELSQTPRRSSRKSIKPPQDYNDIVNKSLRFSTRSAKKNLSENENNHVEIAGPKWTPAKVGRVSQKRSRKSKRTAKQDDSVDEIGQNEQNMVEEQSLNEPKEMEKIMEVSSLQKEKFEKIVDNMQSLNVKSEYKIQKEDLREMQSVKFIEHSGKDFDASEKCTQEEIGIFHESNKIKTDIKENSESKTQPLCTKKSSTEGRDYFGCYTDLGLNLIKNEDDEVYDKEIEIKTKTFSHESEEMPSLIICDDEIEDIEESMKLNEIFKAKENSQEIDDCLKHNEEVMETLQLSDEDSATPIKYPRIVLTDTHLQDHPISSPKDSSHNVKMPSILISPKFSGGFKETTKARITCTPKRLTPKLPTTPKESNESATKTILPSTTIASTTTLLSTPKQSIKPRRFPTPYINRSFKNNDEAKEFIAIKRTLGKNLCNESFISLTTLEPKEIVLRGIRKRSLSVCINDQQRQNFLADPLGQRKHCRVVSFFSPANQTTIIDDLDSVIAKSVSKQKLQEKQLPIKHVTTRRKRSISLDESKILTSLTSKLPRPVPCQNKDSKTQISSKSKTIKRSKLPNFAAIHEKQFKKMENLVEHVNRKQERSKNLLNSSAKKLIMLASTSKSSSLTKNKNITTEKPKAVKKIDLENISQINKSQLNTTTTSLNKTLEESENKTAKKLPDPRLRMVKALNSTANSSNQIRKAQQQIKCLKPSQTANIEKPQSFAETAAVEKKPPFSLSTSLLAKPTSSSNFKEKVNSSHNDKMATRLKSHMNLFKGRAPSLRAGVTKQKNEVILKGVRSNRRFELQMRHRKNLEQ